MAKKGQSDLQGSLFAAKPTCADVDNLPLIIDPNAGNIEVFAPGSIYQPLLLQRDGNGIEATPGSLIDTEEKFVRDLIMFLYPDGKAPRSPATALKWGKRDIWLKRNIEKDPASFRLRVDDSDWFYPDFIVWIIDYETRTQTFGFVDPKGLLTGVGDWNDAKIVATLYMPHVIGLQLKAQGSKVEWDNETWDFRLRGVLLSTTAFNTLISKNKFNIQADDRGGTITQAPTLEQLKQARIVFQDNFNPAYIQDVLNLLVDDTPMDRLLHKAARLEHLPLFTPADEVDYELLLRRDHPQHRESDCNFIASIIRDYLASANNIQQSHAYQQRINQLARTDIGESTTPCEALWRQR